MNREEQIKNAALDWNWILKERGDVNYPDDFTLDVFTEGAKWADANPRWVPVSDKSVILPSYKSGRILVTDGKECYVITVKAFLASVDKPCNTWTHWCKIKLPE